MSITFFAEMPAVDVRLFRVSCEQGGPIGDFPNDEAYGQAELHKLVCTDSLCRDYGADVDEIETAATPLPVNMATRNAVDVLRTLGLAPAIGEEPCGEMDAHAFLILITFAIEIGVTDSGLVDIDMAGGGAFEGGYRNIDCGRVPGYLTGHLTELADLARKCITSGARVVWA